MIEIAVRQCFEHDVRPDERDPHQVVLNVDGVLFWLQMPCKDKDAAEALAEQVRKAVSTQVARYPK